MELHLFQVPYDSGHFTERAGCGPDYFVKNGLAEFLQNAGHQVKLSRIQSQASFMTEIGTWYELNRLLAGEINTLPAGSFPIVLSGNCNSSVGTLAGINRDEIGVIWFDAHGDFNTPETTLSGFLDGMGLAMVTGRCWQALLQQIPGYRRVPDCNVIHVGGIDLDPAEMKMFKDAGIPLVTNNPRFENALLTSLEIALNELCKKVKSVYIHLDLDVLETGSVLTKANQFAKPGGLSVDLAVNCLRLIRTKFEIAACGIASVDPGFDRDQTVLKAGFKLLEAII